MSYITFEKSLGIQVPWWKVLKTTTISDGVSCLLLWCHTKGSVLSTIYKISIFFYEPWCWILYSTVFLGLTFSDQILLLHIND